MKPNPSIPLDVPDGRDGRVYVMPPELDLAIRVSLATGRPLLLRGEPGSGKSSLAPFVARGKGWRYYEHVVTSQTQARDLLWTFDGVRRLADAQAGVRNLANSQYVEPGPLWWAYARESARRRGETTDCLPTAIEPFSEMNAERSPDYAVVLIDEIDKADPDLPNGLLVPLSSGTFTVTEINSEIRKALPVGINPGSTARHLIVLTTNEERELPEAFLRRCVVVWLESPGEQELVAIAREHMTAYDEGWSDIDQALAAEVAHAVVAARERARQLGIRPASTAEFLDALRACKQLGISSDSDEWKLISQFVLFKPQQPGYGNGARNLA
ncbi:AAA family ATPase [Micromonospora sp. CA-269861]|uniref:AAA family ATPase n=1 Tax=Micromonospora sp. CA-269861 TaxID=3239968 RepID=UPI003D8BACC8